MLTSIIIRNFKRFPEVTIELGEAVVLIGPNNSGKTAALQALALWQMGVRRWAERHGPDEPAPRIRPGVTLNRRDLIALPMPSANLLWRNLRTRDVRRVDGQQTTSNIRIEILVKGVSQGAEWECGLEFDYANPESFYCRPMRIEDSQPEARMPVPDAAREVKVAFLPPMSGLAANETRLEAGAVDVRIGEGRTAEVLRNLCYDLHVHKPAAWSKLNERIKELFGVLLNEPEYIAERGEITMSYTEPNSKIELDLSSSGRGMQQTLLLLAYLYGRPGSVFLVDEPDAHLEILRQRQIYQEITQAARQQGSQIIIASHSEVVLIEAAGRDVVVAFVGQPHRIDDRGSQLLKALKDIGFDQYYQAEQKGWVLYLEGSTDLAILQTFARRLGHRTAELLSAPFVKYIGNDVKAARNHFYGLHEAKPDLVGIAIFDRTDHVLQAGALQEIMWQRREIENYLCQPETLLAFADAPLEGETSGTLWGSAGRAQRHDAMQECIELLVPRIAMQDRSHRWWRDTKATDDFLDPLLAEFYTRLGLPGVLRKSNYHLLANYVPDDMIDAEIIAKLDAIVQVAEAAHPVQ